ncbi:MAG: hypothetical protein ACFE0Q_00410 [Anaerolineae bacterium]
MTAITLPHEWHAPPVDFSLAPFWFWNDNLDDAELLRQLDQFQEHGVDAFVIHPRVGLPHHLGWMSEALLAKMRWVIRQAQQRGMWVMLYDEGMYPSGSSSGQVVAENPAYQCRGFVRINLDDAQPDTVVQGIRIGADGKPQLSKYQSLIADIAYHGTNYAIVQRPVDAVIRGLHFLDHHSDDENPPEDTPLAIDLLNPDAVRCFIRLVYQRYHDAFGGYFGSVIRAIFTDEPDLLGRLQETGIIAGSSDSLAYVNDYLGYDFTPYLPALWDENAPRVIREDYERALEQRFEQTYYAQLYAWCDEHNIQLTGHPAEPDATRHLRYFHIPGQDIVWRFIEPDTPSALEGRQSTQAKATSSMMLHSARRRNANEFCGAYGHQLTFKEMRWLANWLLIRGCNLLIPHAFYYSVRGARYHERPPDVGLHSAWWDDGFTQFAAACRRLCWLNTDSQHICHVAILGEHHHLPYRAAKDCLQHQIDFNYLDIDDLARGTLQDGTYHIANQVYRVLIIDGELPPSTPIPDTMPVMYWSDDPADAIQQLKGYIPQTLFSHVNTSGLRVRHLKKHGLDWYVLFNEEITPIEFEIDLAQTYHLNLYTDNITAVSHILTLHGHEMAVLVTQEA